MADELLNITTKIVNAIRSERPRKIAISTVFAAHKPRIFEKGLDANGGKIGTYSTSPISISKARQARNTGRTYFPGGYSEYKSAIGKNPGYVNLRDTDQMMSDYSVIQSGAEIGIGFQNSANADKMGWNEDHFDTEIAKLSEPEFKLFVDTLLYELGNAI